MLPRPGLAIAPLETRYWFRSARMPAKTDRKSTRLNSSHLGISYAVFCLKKKRRRPGGQLGEAKRQGPPEERVVLNRQAMGFFFNDTATTEIYTLSLHDALPI